MPSLFEALMIVYFKVLDPGVRNINSDITRSTKAWHLPTDHAEVFIL